MTDSFVLLTPILLLPVVVLLAFVGCSYNPPRTAGPAAPKLTGEAGDGIVDLSWTEVDDADKYQVKRALTSGGPTSLIAEVVGSFTHTDDTVTNGTTYFYVVTAWQGPTESENSNEVEVTPVGPIDPEPVSFITGKTLGNTVSATGSFGMAIGVGPSALTIKKLGRAHVPGDAQAHIVQIVEATGAAVPNALVSVNMAGVIAGEVAGDFRYATLPVQPPIVLNANTTYFVVTQETSAADQFFNHTSTVQTTNVATVTGSVRSDGVTFTVDLPGQVSYGLVDFQYVL